MLEFSKIITQQAQLVIHEDEKKAAEHKKLAAGVKTNAILLIVFVIVFIVQFFLPFDIPSIVFTILSMLPVVGLQKAINSTLPEEAPKEKAITLPDFLAFFTMILFVILLVFALIDTREECLTYNKFNGKTFTNTCKGVSVEFPLSRGFDELGNGEIVFQEIGETAGFMLILSEELAANFETESKMQVLENQETGKYGKEERPISINRNEVRCLEFEEEDDDGENFFHKMCFLNPNGLMFALAYTEILPKTTEMAALYDKFLNSAKFSTPQPPQKQ